MKTIYALFALGLVGLVSASTFLLTVKKDAESGKPYVEYEGDKYFLTNETNGVQTPFLKDDCLVKIDLSLESKSDTRSGSILCKKSYEKGGLDWDKYVEEQMAAFNATSTTPAPS